MENTMSDTPSRTSGIGTTTVLFIVFLVLKLTETIDWSWWWVTAPVWIPIAFVLALLLIVGLVLSIGHVAKLIKG